MYTYTRTRAAFVWAQLLHDRQGTFSALLFAKTCSEGCIQDPFPYSQGFPGLDRIGNMAQATCVVDNLPYSVCSTSWRGVSSGQNAALNGTLSLLPQSLLTQTSTRCLQEADTR